MTEQPGTSTDQDGGRPSARPDTTVVHLVRHGEVYNPGGILYGRLPGFHLSEEGRLMAKAAAAFLAGRDAGRAVQPGHSHRRAADRADQQVRGDHVRRRLRRAAPPGQLALSVRSVPPVVG